MLDAKLFLLEEMLFFEKHGKPLISVGLLTDCTPEQYFSSLLLQKIESAFARVKQACLGK